VRSRAFTLIEILTVTAIISVLAAILFPVFATAKQRAKQIVCLTNASQIGKAVLMYSNDTETYQLPPGGSYKAFLDPYKVSDLVSPGHVQGYEGIAGWSPGYTLNSCFQRESPQLPEASRIIMVATESCHVFHVDTVVCAQFNAAPDFLYGLGVKVGYKTPYVRTIGLAGSERYFGGGNYVMYDGHGKWSRPQQTFLPFDTSRLVNLCSLSESRFFGSANGITFAAYY